MLQVCKNREKCELLIMGEQSLLRIRGKLFRLILRLQTPSLERRRDVVLSLLIQVSKESHDEEWGVPVHDDKLLFELLVLTGAQVGSDWTSVLKKREAFREAFSGFDAEVVARFTVRTSKSETISKDMVKRGFRFVGPTVIHSFMQAGGLRNDHLITCPRHLQSMAFVNEGGFQVAA